MSLSPSDEADFRPRSFAALETPGLSLVSEDLPAQWDDDGIPHLLTRVDATTWEVASLGTVLGILTHVPPLAIGDWATWRISDPQQQTLGVGASWANWEDAVANLVDYRRRRRTV
jgi:hypothetical protein